MTHEMTLDDARLARRLAATLDRAAEAGHDAAWDARMAHILASASAPRRSHRWQWSGGIAVAASVAFMLALPGDWMQQAGSTQAAPAQQQKGGHVDGQMLDEMDWLMSMEAASREGR